MEDFLHEHEDLSMIFCIQCQSLLFIILGAMSASAFHKKILSPIDGQQERLILVLLVWIKFIIELHSTSVYNRYVMFM